MPDLWSVHGHCEVYNVLSGHKNAILDLDWSGDSSCVASCLQVANMCAATHVYFPMALQLCIHRLRRQNGCLVGRRGAWVSNGVRASFGLDMCV